jgi:hypothetical protein
VFLGDSPAWRRFRVVLSVRSLSAVALSVSLTMLVSPAWGGCPGRNGNLAVQPVDGGGLLVVAPQGGRVHHICVDVLLCGVPVGPRWSPDGREIVFADTSSSRVGIVAATGECLWCLLGRPLSTLHVGRPAFTADGGAVTLATQHGQWRVSMSGAPGSRPLSGVLTDAVWLARG